MNWAKGYSASYYLSIIDKNTMRDIDRREIISGSIVRSDSELRESADIDCRGYDSKTEQYIRIWLDARQGGDSSHIPLFTGLATSPTHQYSGRVKSSTLQCYSILKVAQDVMLPRGWYAPTDARGGDMIEQLLSVLKLPESYINIEPDSPPLSQAIIAEQSENHLSMIDRILDAMGWQMRLDGYGRVFIEDKKKNSDALVLFDSNEMDMIENEIDVSYDWFSAPNVLRCSLDDNCAIAIDDDPNSPLSTVSRGREVWYEDTEVFLNTDETLAEYASRMLKYYQRVATNISYNRRYYPGIYPGDRIQINYPAQGVFGTFLITDQNITLGYNARTSEEVVQV